ncbi:hypothetical protein SAMN05444274_104419 [Mariniphaga anaerophila]|uniref:Uncharacterized protein n=1 Tax=Mariniphaga anaerophila TaxID=1484053 RepID=A0A1M5APP3_9BACT|nr:hypothetical protein [Mariniphaga anaerophila]SHF32231.1 hypothetical protein SAMN05444274_104419 [Mariniphaga anaerophila]
MTKSNEISRWMFVLLPALAMMLGWGLRGHIGGGPFGAMIPGAMVALCICLLLKLPAAITSIIVVFGVFGIGIGGEMTYGQTLGFLRHADTVWWGTAGTTLKGAVWGLLGGAVFSLGFLYRRVPKKTIIYGLLLMLVGFVLGFKLINDPKILYFSGPEKPRAESWAALLFGAIALIVYLKYKIKSADFKLVSRFAFYGMIGGGLGFGLGGFWMVLGSNLPDTIYKDWWKAMEFTFGLLLGASLGLAAWKSRKAIHANLKNEDVQETAPLSVVTELGLLFFVALLVFWLIPNLLEPFVDGAVGNDGFLLSLLRTIARIAVNYAFYGILFVLVIMRYPKVAWQIGITLTFCHAAIDLVRDFYPGLNPWDPFTMHFFWVFLMTSIVALLTVYFSRKQNSIRNLFLLLIWSCIGISLLRLALLSGSLSISGMNFCEVICRRFFVDLFFIVNAVVVTSIILKKEIK